MITLTDRKNRTLVSVDETTFFCLTTAMIATFYMLPWKGVKWPDRELVFECASPEMAQQMREVIPNLDRPFRDAHAESTEQRDEAIRLAAEVGIELKPYGTKFQARA